MTPNHIEAIAFADASTVSTLADLYNHQNKEQPFMVLDVKKYAIILPVVNSNPCLRDAHTLVRNWLVDAFDGFTSYQGTSAWQDQRGRKHVEEHIRYEVADFGRVGSESFLQIAQRLLERSGEECLYIEINGTPRILAAE